LLIRNARHEYCAELSLNPAIAAGNLHQPGPLALAVKEFLAESSHMSETREKMEGDPDRALGGIDEELYLLTRDPGDNQWMTNNADAGPAGSYTFLDDGRKADDREIN
jgi:hypothetical protein